MLSRIFTSIIIIALISFAIFMQQRSTPSTPPSNEKAYISVESGGQLGNQMFHFAAAIAYALDHGLEARFPILNESYNQLSYNRDAIFFRLNPSPAPLLLTKYSVQRPNYEKLPDDLRNINLSGGLFSWKFFDHRKKEIQDLYAPSQNVLNKLYLKYGDLLALDHTVGVHVRTYSKTIHEQGLHFVGMQYFDETIHAFPSNYVFVIFSDRTNWCKEHFTKRFPNTKFIFIEGNDHIEDLFLMSFLKHNILSKSTFSWWSAYLNKNPDKIVYAPVKKSFPIPNVLKKGVFAILDLFGYHFWSNEEYYLPEWKIAYYELEPYPEDIYEYGDISKSVEPADK